LLPCWNACNYGNKRATRNGRRKAGDEYDPTTTSEIDISIIPCWYGITAISSEVYICEITVRRGVWHISTR
jgi:hypothetical protein